MSENTINLTAAKAFFEMVYSKYVGFVQQWEDDVKSMVKQCVSHLEHGEELMAQFPNVFRDCKKFDYVEHFRGLIMESGYEMCVVDCELDPFETYEAIAGGDHEMSLEYGLSEFAFTHQFSDQVEASNCPLSRDEVNKLADLGEEIDDLCYEMCSKLNNMMAAGITKDDYDKFMADFDK